MNNYIKSLAVTVAALFANVAHAVTTLDYTGQAFTNSNTAAFGTSLDGVVTLKGTLPTQYSGTLTAAQIASFTLSSVNGVSATTSNGLFEDVTLTAGQVTSWDLFVPSAQYGGIGLGTSSNGMGISTDIVQAYQNIGVLAPNAQNYTFNPGTWTIGTASAVPEPATWAAMLLGFGGLGMALRAARRPSNEPTVASGPGLGNGSGA